MQTGVDIIVALRKRGWRLWTQGGRLYYRAPKGNAGPEEVETLARLKPEVLAALLLLDPATAPARLLPRIPSEYAPLTFTQQAFREDALTWGTMDTGRIGDVLTCATAECLVGSLNRDALSASLNELVRRHETLRTKIVAVDGTCMQQVCREPRHDLEVLDLTSSSDVEQKARELVDATIYEPAGSLFRVRLLKLANRRHILVIAMHHLISDAASLGVIARELREMYDQADRGRSPDLPRGPIQYADYAVWQHQSNRWWADTHGAYWESRLADAPQANFQAESVGEPGARFRLTQAKVDLGLRISEALQEVARNAGTTLAMSVLAVYVAVLCLWQRKSDWVVRFVVDGRDRPELEGVVGYVASVLYLRIQLSKADTYAALLGKVTREYRNAYLHNDFGRLQLSGATHAWKRAPFFNWIPPAKAAMPADRQRALSFPTAQPFPITALEEKCQYEAQAIGVREPEIILSDTVSGVSGVLSYPQEFYQAETMQQVVYSLRRTAQVCAERPDIMLEELQYER